MRLLLKRRAGPNLTTTGYQPHHLPGWCETPTPIFILVSTERKLALHISDPLVLEMHPAGCSPKVQPHLSGLPHIEARPVLEPKLQNRTDLQDKEGSPRPSTRPHQILLARYLRKLAPYVNSQFYRLAQTGNKPLGWSTRKRHNYYS